MVLTPGAISPIRDVPSDITRPEYVGRRMPSPYLGSEIQSEETIAKMRIAGRLAARAMNKVARAIAPGVSLTNSTALDINICAIRVPTPRPSDIEGSPNLSAHRSTRSSATEYLTRRFFGMATSSTLISPPTSTECTVTLMPPT